MRKLISYTIITLTLASCANDTLVERSDQADDNVIECTATTDLYSRSADYYSYGSVPSSFRMFSARNSDNLKYMYDVEYRKIAAGDTYHPIGYYYDDSGNISHRYGNSQDEEAANTHLWPDQTTKLDFYAISGTNTECSLMGPYSQIGIDDESSTTVTFPLVTNSITLNDNAANNNDILYAITYGKKGADKIVPLNFRHALAAFQFKVKVSNPRLYVKVKSIAIAGLINKAQLALVRSHASDIITTDHNDNTNTDWGTVDNQGDNTAYNSNYHQCDWIVDSWGTVNGTWDQYPHLGEVMENIAYTGTQTLYVNNDASMASTFDAQYDCISGASSYHTAENTGGKAGFAYTLNYDASTPEASKMLVIPQPYLYAFNKDGYIDISTKKTKPGENPKFVINCDVYNISDKDHTFNATDDELLFSGNIQISFSLDDLPLYQGTLYTAVFDFGGTGTSNSDALNPVSFTVKSEVWNNGTNDSMTILELNENNVTLGGNMNIGEIVSGQN